MTGLAFPKFRPRALDKQDRKQQLDAQDRLENEKARKRAMGRCEIFVVSEGRCSRRDNQTHHMIGGSGKRQRGPSILADHKQRTCQRCHDQIGQHILQRIPNGTPLPRWDDAYERVR